MRTSTLSLCLCAGVLSAQDFPKNEIQTLYLHGQIDGLLTERDPAVTGRFSKRRPHTGFALSYVRNTSPISGLKLEVSWMRDENTVRTASSAFTYRQVPLWILAGPQFKRNRNDTGIKPFFHMLGGASLYRTSLDSNGQALCAEAFQVMACPARFDSDRWTFAFVIGAGVDLRLTERVDLRIVQVDYTPLSRFGKTAHNVRFGVGIIFH